MKNKEAYKQMVTNFVGKKTADAAEELQEEKAEPTPKGRGRLKEDLTGEDLENCLSEEVKELVHLRRGRPRMKTLQEEGVYVRTSFVLRALYLEKLRQIAFQENVTLKDIVEEAFKAAIETYERKRGAITLTSRQGSAKGLFDE